MPRPSDRPRAHHLWPLLTLVTMGCGHAPVLNPLAGATTSNTRGPAALTSSQQVAGSWDLVLARRDRAGDGLIDQHELQLRWIAEDIVGVWDRSRSWVAAPGLAFVESNSTQCLLRRRHLLRGRLQGNAIELSAVRPLTHGRSTCSAPLPLPRSCLARRRGPRLELSCGKERLTFSRRSEPTTPLALAIAPPNEVTGIWTWHHRSVDGEGDLKIEHETWHLVQRGSRVEGFYDRVVRMRSRDGRPFRCNDELGYRNAARFRVRGLIAGGEVYLKEISYSTAPSDCETGRRRLDRYIGVLEPKSGRIQLRWRSGAQFLQRRH